MSSTKFNSKREIKDRTTSRAGATQKFPANLGFATLIAASLLIFLSVFPVAGADVWYEAGAAVVIFILCAVNFLAGKTPSGNWNLLAPLLLLAVFSMLQGLASIFFPVYSAVFPLSFNPTASLWSGYKMLAAVLFLDLLLKTGSRHIKFFVWSLVVTGNFFAVFGIARYLFQANIYEFFLLFISSRLEVGVGFGTYFNQNHYALLMLMTLGLNIGLFWYAKTSKTVRLLLLAASLISWTALVLTGSRGGIISSFAEIALLLFLPVIRTIESKHRSKGEVLKNVGAFLGRQAVILIIAFGLLIAGIVFIGQDRVVERFEDIPGQIGGVTNAATFRRTDAWQAALLMIRDFPLFGVGFGGYQTAVSQYIDISGQLVPKQAHNDYLELAASGGILAAVFAGWFAFVFFSLVGKRFAEAPDNFSGAARAGAICAIAGVALHSFFDFGLQITANFLFFVALLFVAVHKPPSAGDAGQSPASPRFFAIFRLLLPVICLCLAVSAAFFGFARYQAVRVKADPAAGSAEKRLYPIPFDAVYFETKAAVHENAGDIERAAHELQMAIGYRPKDYDLWLRSGELEHLRNRPAEAEKAFRTAIELAPNYGKPYFFYGNFLLKINRQAEALNELRTATRRNPQYFEEVVPLIWNEKNGNAAETIDALKPLDALEKEKLSVFLLEKREFRAVTELNCGDPDLTEPKRYGLIHQLLDKKRYYYAERLYKQNCDFSGQVAGEIEDGGFENKAVEEKTGFGWRVPSFSGSTTVSFDNDSQEKGSSLRFGFNGQDNSYALLSQLVTVEKSRRYRLNFSYKTNEIVTGGVPVLQIILKKPDSESSESIAGEVKLSLREKNWVQSSLEFETDQLTEAIEIRLTRQTCAESLCPIFGELWVDDFYLQKKN